MYKNKRVLALIPARGGSKSLPGKNIKPLNGKPLIAWTIAAAKKSRYIDEIVVSTDNRKIRAVAKRYGAKTPFLRPKRLATDTAKGMDVMLHALNWFKDVGEAFSLIILLQPTSPLRIAQDIDKAVETLFSKKAKVVISTCKTDYPFYLTNELPKNGCMKNFTRFKLRMINRQDLPQFYKVNGAVYVAFCDYIMQKKCFWGDKTFAYVMPEERSIDIDSNQDFMFAEFLNNRRQLKRSK